MQILYLHQYFSTPQGATGTRSYEMSKRLVKKGHKVTIVCIQNQLSKTHLLKNSLDKTKRDYAKEIKIKELPLAYSNYDSLFKRSLIFFKYVFYSLKIAFGTKYDILLASSTPLTVSIVGIIMKIFKPYKKFVFEVRDLWPEIPKDMGVIKNSFLLFGLSTLEFLAYNFADACIALSPGIKKGIIKKCLFKKDIIMIPNACDMELVESVNKKSILYSNDKIPKSGLRAIFAGAFGTLNNLDAALDAANILKKRGRKDISLIFIGDGKLKPKLEKRAIIQRLDNCIFLNPVPKTTLFEIFKNVDVGLMLLADIKAFYYGTSPNKFFDYIASSLPVLNNYKGWIADLIKANNCGIAIEGGDAIAFADALEKFADNKAMLQTMSVNTFKIARDFDREKLANDFVAFLEKQIIQRSQ